MRGVPTPAPGAWSARAPRHTSGAGAGTADGASNARARSSGARGPEKGEVVAEEGRLVLHVGLEPQHGGVPSPRTCGPHTRRTRPHTRPHTRPRPQHTSVRARTHTWMSMCTSIPQRRHRQSAQRITRNRAWRHPAIMAQTAVGSRARVCWHYTPCRARRQVGDADRDVVVALGLPLERSLP